MHWAIRIGVVLVGLYALLALLACACARPVLYPAPTPPRPLPGRGASRETRTPDGHPVFAWHLAAPAGAPTIVFFHGNGQQVADLEAFGVAFRQRGLGFLAVEYPGYGPAHAQSPSESSIFDAAEAAIGDLHGALGVAVSDTVLMGQSLGTGVATEMARRGHGAQLVLVSPYTSIAAVAQRSVPIFPMRVLLGNPFDTSARAPDVAIPVLIVHGDRDTLIPVSMGRTLAAQFPHATLRVIPARGHNNLFADDDDVIDLVSAFIRRRSVVAP